MRQNSRSVSRICITLNVTSIIAYTCCEKLFAFVSVLLPLDLNTDFFLFFQFEPSRTSESSYAQTLNLRTEHTPVRPVAQRRATDTVINEKCDVCGYGNSINHIVDWPRMQELSHEILSTCVVHLSPKLCVPLICTHVNCSMTHVSGKHNTLVLVNPIRPRSFLLTTLGATTRASLCKNVDLRCHDKLVVLNPNNHAIVWKYAVARSDMH